MFYERVKELCKNKGVSPSGLCNYLGLSTTNAVNWKNGRLPKMDIAIRIADALGVTVDYLMSGEKNPTVTEEYATFPVIGEIAAGYDSLSVENWDGDTVDIPLSYLKGRSRSEFFVLSVKGDSMYPQYLEGDKVLILKSDSLEYSGQIGAVLYEDDYTTLKKVEYKPGEDWMRLVPINPSVPPVMVEGERLEHCRVIGIPKLLIREL